MHIEFKYGLYVARDTTDDEAQQLEASGWKLNAVVRAMATRDIALVVPWADYCVDDSIKRRVKAVKATHEAAIAPSMSFDANIDVPCPPGLAYRPYQLAGIKFATERKDTLIADDMRLGKTVQAIGFTNTLPTLKSVLIVCQANTKTQWRAEWLRWSTNPDLTVGIAYGKDWPGTDVVIINYDILTRHRERLYEREWCVLIVDESHNLSNPDSQRTAVILGAGREPEDVPLRAKRRLFLTGTPIFTKPVGIWPVVRACDPERLGRKYWDFVKTYCGATAQNKWDVGGASNGPHLNLLLRSRFMIRRSKGEVVKEIPSQRNTVVLPWDGLEKLVKAEMTEFEQRLRAFEAAAVDETRALGIAESVQSTAYASRQDLALAKLPMCITWLEELLTVENKVVVWCHHREVAARLKVALAAYNPVMIIGGIGDAARDTVKDAFQTDPTVRVLVANIRAAGSGVSFSAADTNVFVEYDWSPSAIAQAEQRIWLPEKTVPLTHWRLVVQNSLEERLVRVVDQRMANAEKALNTEYAVAQLQPVV